MAGTICTCGLLQVRKAGTSEIDGREHCNRCGLPLEFEPGDLERMTATVELNRPSAEQRRVKGARDRLIGYAFVGGILYLVGTVAAFAALVSVENSLPGEEISVGTAIVMFLGGITATVGLVLIAIAVIGWGVKLGREAAELS